MEVCFSYLFYMKFKKIEISELADLIRDSLTLTALYNEGIDNWDYSEDALRNEQNWNNASDEQLTEIYETL